jgi:hypothetical protein
MHSDCRRSTVFIDLDVWPPSPVVIDTEYVASFDVLPDGRLVVYSMLTAPESGYMIRIHPRGWPAKPATGPPDVYHTPTPGDIWEVHTVGERVVSFRSLIEKDGRPETKRAYALMADRFQPARDLPKVQTFDPGRLAHQTYANGKVTMADRTEVLIWDGNGYELKGGRFERTWELAAEDSVGLGGWTAVPWGEDGFFYLSGRQVWCARRGADPVPVMPDADNVMFLSPGPGGSVIASHGKNRKALAARVWFPADGTYIPVTRKELGIAPNSSPDELYWSAVTRHVYTKFGSLVTFPDTDLLALKAVRPRGAGYRVS